MTPSDADTHKKTNIQNKNKIFRSNRLSIFNLFFSGEVLHSKLGNTCQLKNKNEKWTYKNTE
jgi:hypothetical protein